MIKVLTSKQKGTLLRTFENRFNKNMKRHEGLDWEKVQSKLGSNPNKLWSLNGMELTGGEPDVINFDNKACEFIFFDCAAESPKERRSVCYDKEGLESRKQHKPKNNAVDMAIAMGVDLLSEAEYRQLQELGNFDTKTSSWLKTPDEIRKLGGAIFGDFRFGQVFIYHNGAESYYGARGFRCKLSV